MRGRSTLLAGFQEHYDELVRFLTRRLGDAGRAADVAHETYVRLTAVPDPGPELRDARAFVFRVASNIAIDGARRDQRLGRISAAAEDGDHVPDGAPSAEERVLARERLDTLDRALAELPPNARRALLLSRVDGRSHAEIARALGVSESMVAKYLAQALKHCRARIRQFDRDAF